MVQKVVDCYPESANPSFPSQMPATEEFAGAPTTPSVAMSSGWLTAQTADSSSATFEATAKVVFERVMAGPSTQHLSPLSINACRMSPELERRPERPLISCGRQ